jgi:uncharacterized membrane protein YgaE (UPF0421/DUF939 family)
MLTSNDRFKKEYEDFAKKISMISDEKVRNETSQLLQKMISEARSIDRHHEELLKGSRLATDVVSNHRSSLTTIRQQIVRKLESCKKAGLIKS